MLSSFFNGPAAGFWPSEAILTVMQRHYDRVEHMADENNGRFYEVQLNGLTFLAIMIHAEGEPEKIVQFGFLSYFAGFEVTPSGVEALNRNLHISVAELDEQNHLILFSMIQARGTFLENRFLMVMEAWHRDIVLTLKMILPGASLRNSLSGATWSSLKGRLANYGPLAGLDMTSKSQIKPDISAQNSLGNVPKRQPSFDAGDASTFDYTDSCATPVLSASAGRLTGHDVARLELQKNAAGNFSDHNEILARFLGFADQKRQLCEACDGRGRMGFPVRNCKSCGGSGLKSS